MKSRAGLKLCGRKPRQAPTSTAEMSVGGGRRRRAGQAQVVAVDEEASAAMPTTPAASPSRPSTKFTALIVSTISRMVSTTPASGPSEMRAERDRQHRKQLHARRPSGRRRASARPAWSARRAPGCRRAPPSRQMSPPATSTPRSAVVEDRAEVGQAGGHQQRRGEARGTWRPRRAAGVGTSWTSRSRPAAMHPGGSPPAHQGCARYVTSAATSRTRNVLAHALSRRAWRLGVGRERVDEVAHAGRDLGRAAAVGVAGPRVPMSDGDLLHLGLGHALGRDRRACRPGCRRRSSASAGRTGWRSCSA